jgi:tartrate-resistant acid phosphatase type 5
MSLIKPTRRELLKAVPALIGVSALPAFGQTGETPLNFLVIGDWGRDGRHFQRHVAQQMGRSARNLGSRFVVTTGDNFYLLGVSSRNDSQWRTSFRDIYTAESLHRPWFPVLGNHDYGGSVRAQVDYQSVESRWQMRDRWYPVSGTEFGHPGVEMFFIDTVVWQGKEKFPFSWLGSSIRRGDQQQQRDWLISRLEAAANARVKLVFGHHPIYSVGPHGGAMQMQDLDEVLRRYGVTAYVCGHDHCLYHISRDGMHYICSGAGSEVLTRYTGGMGPGCVFANTCQAAAGDQPAAVWHAFLSIAGFAAFQIGDQVTFNFVDMAGNMRHSATI